MSMALRSPRGGNLAGSNLTIPGSGNTIKLTLGKAHLG
jgi:hypothetical protein